MKPGDQLYFVHNYNSNGNRPLTVSRVGRLWAYFENEPRWKMDLKTWHVYEAEWVAGHCYESEQAYRDRLLVRHQIARFRRLIDDAELTDLAAVRKAAEILGLEL
jgi:hypothetical protein